MTEKKNSVEAESVDVERAFACVSDLVMQVAISVPDKTLRKKITVLRLQFRGFFALCKCSDLIVVLSFVIKGLLADILGLNCGVDFAFCFAFYRVWNEWEYLCVGKYIHETTGNCRF